MELKGRIRSDAEIRAANCLAHHHRLVEQKLTLVMIPSYGPMKRQMEASSPTSKAGSKSLYLGSSFLVNKPVKLESENGHWNHLETRKS